MNTIVLRLIIVNQFFYPDISATSQIITDLAEDLVVRGIQVTVLSSRRTYLGGPTRLLRQENYRGVHIQRVGGTGFGKSSLLARLADYLSFYFLCALHLLRMPRHDAILVFTTPPLIAFLCWLICRIRRMKLIYSVQDLYPQVAIEMGMLERGRLITNLWERVAKRTLVGADHVIVLGACMQRRIEQEGISGKKITVIPNWSDDINLIPLPEERNWFWQKHGLTGKFVIQYSGNMGRCHEFTTVLLAAKELASEEKILFLFIGNGERRREIQEFCEHEKLQNIQILDYQAREDLLYSLNACSVSLVTLRKGMEGLIVPSKFYGILATGKPVLYIGPEECDVAHVITNFRCGFTIAPGDVKGFIQAIQRLQNNPILCTQMGKQGRDILLSQFTRQKSTLKYYHLLSQMVDHAKESGKQKVEDKR